MGAQDQSEGKSMRRLRVIGVTSVVCLIFGLQISAREVVAITCPVNGFHCFSWAREESVGGGYTGVRNDHYVVSISNPGSANPVYQFMWLSFGDNGGSDFIELGTQYADNMRYTYAYQRKAAVGSWLYQELSPAVGSHSYKIVAHTNNSTTFDFYVDGVKLPVSGSAVVNNGVMATVGLESYHPTIVFPVNSTYDLKYKQWNGAFQSWSGKDDSHVDIPMCGLWQSVTAWESGENTTCV